MQRLSVKGEFNCYIYSNNVLHNVGYYAFCENFTPNKPLLLPIQTQHLSRDIIYSLGPPMMSYGGIGSL